MKSAIQPVWKAAVRLAVAGGWQLVRVNSSFACGYGTTIKVNQGWPVSFTVDADGTVRVCTSRQIKVRGGGEKGEEMIGAIKSRVFAKTCIAYSLNLGNK